MADCSKNSFGARSTLRVNDRDVEFFDLSALESGGTGNPSRLPFCLRILLENLLRLEDGSAVSAEDVEALVNWDPAAAPSREIAFAPARVILQDFTGVPALVDLAAMRDAMAEMGGDPDLINPMVPAELVIDHSVQVDSFGLRNSFLINLEREFERNRERYAFLRWGQTSFSNFKVVPPGTGIVHQVNLEYLARVVFEDRSNGAALAYPDTLVGTDSHTTMINGLGVLGWGVGGIEAEAAMLGQPISLLIPQVVGFRLHGTLPEGATATDLVLTTTEMLRRKGVVGKFVEFYGPGLSTLSLADRATLGNMSPEYGATCAIFPIDAETVEYLRFTGRSQERLALVEAYAKAQGLFHTAQSREPEYTDTVELDLGTVEPSLAGPRRPQDRIALNRSKAAFSRTLQDLGRTPLAVPVTMNPDPDRETVRFELRDGAVVIAAITSCTNTSNPSVMVGAGLVARKAVERGLASKPWVKTSLAPGSKVVTEYLNDAGLLPYLEQLGFSLVGYGCTTCIGNSGPLPEAIGEAVKANDLVVCSVLSGNRNFEGRIQPQVRATYLASPPLVVAYALAGRMDIDLESEPIGQDQEGRDVFLRDLWPSQEEIRNTVRAAIKPAMFSEKYADVFSGDETWRGLPIPEGNLFDWDEESTYIRQPPFFVNMPAQPEKPGNIEGMRVLALLDDSVTTDHISPAGAIPPDGPAGCYLTGRGIEPRDYNSFGSRRGNHEVMMRGTFANIRLRNLLAPGTEGGWTMHPSSARPMSIFDAAMKYQESETPLLVIAGKEYGSGSSRDWAAKGTRLLGVRAVLAQSFERIHRSNLIGMGVLPLQFEEGQSASSLGLTGRESFDLTGLEQGLEPRQNLTLRARGDDGSERRFSVLARVDTPNEVSYYQHGGILQFVLRTLNRQHPL